MAKAPTKKEMIENIKGGKKGKVKEALQQGFDPNATLLSKFTPLTFAFENNQMEIVERLLEAGANPTLKDPRYVDLFTIFEQTWHPNLSEIFQKHEDKLNEKAKESLRAIVSCQKLIEAVRKGQFKEVEEILDSGVNPNFTFSVDVTKDTFKRVGFVQVVSYANLLTLCAMNKRHKIATLLMERGIFKDNIDYFDFTPLMWAVEKDDFEMVKLLVEAEIQINRGKNFTALSLALRDGKKEMAEYLLQNGADPNYSPMGFYKTAIEYVENNTELRELLIKYGAIEFKTSEEMAAYNEKYWVKEYAEKYGLSFENPA